MRTKQTTIDHLISEDVRSSEEIAELKKMIWELHRELPDQCQCKICTEVEQSQKELEDPG